MAIALVSVVAACDLYYGSSKPDPRTGRPPSGPDAGIHPPDAYLGNDGGGHPPDAGIINDGGGCCGLPDAYMIYDAGGLPDCHY